MSEGRREGRDEDEVWDREGDDEGDNESDDEREGEDEGEDDVDEGVCFLAEEREGEGTSLLGGGDLGGSGFFLADGGDGEDVAGNDGDNDGDGDGEDEEGEDLGSCWLAGGDDIFLGGGGDDGEDDVFARGEREVTSFLFWIRICSTQFLKVNK